MKIPVGPRTETPDPGGSFAVRFIMGGTTESFVIMFDPSFLMGGETG